VGLLREGVGEVYLPAATYALDLIEHLRKRRDVFSRLSACTRIRRLCREGDGFFPYPLELIRERGSGVALPLGLSPYTLLHINLLSRCGKYSYS
jgi:hypothetical protein